jgi:hypothetical protein
MTEIASSRRSITARSLTWTMLAAVPALAILTLGSGVFTGSLTGSTVPATASVEDTREFSRQGDDLAALTGSKSDGSDDSAMNQWQNTVRRRPSPRR